MVAMAGSSSATCPGANLEPGVALESRLKGGGWDKILKSGFACCHVGLVRCCSGEGGGGGGGEKVVETNQSDLA